MSRVNERRYEFGDENGAESWVCAKIPHDGAIKKDCVPKVLKLEPLARSSKVFQQMVVPSLKANRELIENATRSSLQCVLSEGGTHLVCAPPAQQGLCGWKHFLQKGYFPSTSIFFKNYKPTQGCNGFVCFCDDRDGCNSGQR